MFIYLFDISISKLFICGFSNLFLNYTLYYIGENGYFKLRLLNDIKCLLIKSYGVTCDKTFKYHLL